jgi:hypothetical protein
MPFNGDGETAGELSAEVAIGPPVRKKPPMGEAAQVGKASIKLSYSHPPLAVECHACSPAPPIWHICQDRCLSGLVNADDVLGTDGGDRYWFGLLGGDEKDRQVDILGGGRTT